MVQGRSWAERLLWPTQPCLVAAQQECEAILLKVLASGAQRLGRWAAKIEELYPGFEHDIPPEAELNIAKLGGGGALSTDTCDQARIMTT